MGLSAGFLEPLESTSIHLIQSGLLRLMRFFPDRGFAEEDAEAYNAQTALEFEQVRDFIILHYHANHREDSEFWRYLREMSIPESLDRKLRLWRANARLFREQNDLFNEFSWVQVLIGQGVIPRGYDPLAANLTDTDAHRMLENVKDVIRRSADHMPDHQAFIDEHCKAPPV